MERSADVEDGRQSRACAAGASVCRGTFLAPPEGDDSMGLRSMTEPRYEETGRRSSTIWGWGMR